MVRLGMNVICYVYELECTSHSLQSHITIAQNRMKPIHVWHRTQPWIKCRGNRTMGTVSLKSTQSLFCIGNANKKNAPCERAFNVETRMLCPWPGQPSSISRDCLLILYIVIRARLHQVSESMLRQIVHDASDTVLIENNGVAWKWVAPLFWSNSIVFNETSITSIITTLMLTLGVNGPFRILLFPNATQWMKNHRLDSIYE